MFAHESAWHLSLTAIATALYHAAAAIAPGSGTAARISPNTYDERPAYTYHPVIVSMEEKIHDLHMRDNNFNQITFIEIYIYGYLIKK